MTVVDERLAERLERIEERLRLREAQLIAACDQLYDAQRFLNYDGEPRRLQKRIKAAFPFLRAVVDSRKLPPPPCPEQMPLLEE